MHLPNACAWPIGMPWLMPPIRSQEIDCLPYLCLSARCYYCCACYLLHRDVNASIKTRSGDVKPILSGVSGVAKPGCLTAIM